MDLLFAHGDDGSPMLDREADPSTAADEARPQQRREERFIADITANANDLVSQGWAVVTPAGKGVVAAELGVPRSEVAEAAEVYRAAGRAALAAVLGRRPAEQKNRPS